MAAITVTETTPVRLYHAGDGTAGAPRPAGIRIADGGTGTVYIARSQAKCVSGATTYFKDTDSGFYTDLTLGEELWGVAKTGGGSINVVTFE